MLASWLSNSRITVPVRVSATQGAWETVTVNDLPFNSGANQIQLVAVDGGVSIDKLAFVYIVGSTTSTEKNTLPEGYTLAQNYPNPFNPVTNIQYELGAASKVRLTVYDVLGRQVATLVDGMQGAGQYRVNFNGADLASGLYLYRLETPVGTQVRTMMLLK